MIQYQAGYIPETLKKGIFNKEDSRKVSELLNFLSYFDVEFSDEKQHEPPSKPDPLVAVATNIVTRGLPTRLPAFLQDIFNKAFGQFFPVEEGPETNKDILHEISQKIIHALHVVEPRVQKDFQVAAYHQNWDKFGSEHDDRFYYSITPEYLGEHFLQLFTRERKLSSIIEHSPNRELIINSKDYVKDIENIDSVLDFSLQFPYPVEGKHGLVIEIVDNDTENLDPPEVKQLRDAYLEKAGWFRSIRIDKLELAKPDKKIKALKALLAIPYLDQVDKNFRTPCYACNEGKNILQLALSPMAIARVQRTLLHFINTGALDLRAKEWKIGILERDVPCGLLAMESLKRLLENLITLSGRKTPLPQIKLYTFSTPEFENSQLSKPEGFEHTLAHYLNVPFKKFSEFLAFDVLIDNSVLQRSSVVNPELKTNAFQVANIRSASAPMSHRKVQIADMVQYQPTIKKFNPSKFEAIPEREKAIEEFAADFFGWEMLKPGQLQLFDLALQLKNSIGYLPSNGGKSLSYVLAAYLQPGVSFVATVPQGVENIFQTLKEYHIGHQTYLGSYFFNDKTFSSEKFTEGVYQLAFANPIILHSNVFRALTEKLYEENNYFTYLVIENAHSMSEWGHNFRPAFSKLNQTASQILKTSNNNHICALAYTSTASYDVLADIKTDLGISTSNVIIQDLFRKELEYKVLPVPCTNLYYNTLFDVAKNNVGSKKQVNTSYLVSDIFYENGKKYADEGLLIFCPEQKGIYGISDINNDGLADKLKLNHKDLKIGTYTGHFDDEQSHADKVISKKSETAALEFQSGKADILVSNYSYGANTEKKDIRHTIHFNYPGSVEAYIEQTSVSGKDGKPAECTILYNNQPFRYTNESIADKEGEKSLLSREINITIDKHYGMQALSNLVADRKKEGDILHELLNEIQTPAIAPEDFVYKQIEETLGERVDFLYLPTQAPYQLVVNKGKSTFGYIDYRNFSNATEDSDFEESRANQVLNYIKNLISGMCPKGANVFDWLTKGTESEALRGIEKRLDSMEEGASGKANIHFRNNALAHIQELINKDDHTGINKRQVYLAYKESNSPGSFLKNILSFIGFKEEPDTFPKAQEIKLQYFNIRDFADTQRAIHRLGTIGVIDDYTIDFKEENFVVYFNKKDDSAYLNALSSFLLQYMSREYAMKIFNGIHRFPGDTVIQKCTNILLLYVHKNILPKRTKSLLQMDALCANAMESDLSETEQSERIKDYLKHYFFSRYANKYVQPSLEIDTDQGKTSNFDSILKYVKEVGGSVDNWNHLKKSTEILLKKYPNNYVLLQLNAYSSLLLEHKDQALFQKAFDKMVLGFVKMSEKEKLNYQEYMSLVRQFLGKLYEQNSNLKKRIEPLLYLKTNYTWLVNFNKKFLSDFKLVS